MSKKVERIRIGNKYLSLNDIWRLCLKMWKEIKDEYSIEAKKKWLRRHGFNPEKVQAGCFFCEWSNQHDCGNDCIDCPGKLVDKKFDCSDGSYSYCYEPKKFYRKIAALDEKRKGRK